MKIGLFLKGANWTAIGGVATGLGVGAALLVVGASIDITPAARSQQQTPAVEQNNPERQAVIDGVQRLIESSVALIRVSNASARPNPSLTNVGSETTSIILWLTDDVDPGVVNLGELVVLSQRPVLGAITATTFGADPTDDDAGPPTPASALRSLYPVRTLRGRVQTNTRVIATGVRAMTVDQARISAIDTQITLELTWDAGAADAPETSTISAVTHLWNR